MGLSLLGSGLCQKGSLFVCQALLGDYHSLGIQSLLTIFASAHSARYYAIELCVRALDTQVD
jgi:hypothetical protein